MKFEAVTIKDIAKALGLSTSTVSRALRDSYEISPETKDRVLAYAKQINYRPNPIALSLKEKRSRSIGVIISEIANSFFSQAIDGIESVAHDRGYNVIIAQSKESFDKEMSAINYLASRSVDGILISISSETKDVSLIEDLHSKGLPFVCFDRIINELDTFKICFDNFKTAYNATTQLIRNGYKRIAHLANAEYLSITQERVAGYRKALEDNKLPFEDRLMFYARHGGLVYQEVEDAMNAALRLKPGIDAVFASSDKLTTNILRYCRKHKVSIPDELGLLGFSNLDLTDLLSPSLSVVHQPAFEMGKLAAESLLKIVESKRPIKDYETFVLPGEILHRESSRKRIVTIKD